MSGDRGEVDRSGGEMKLKEYTIRRKTYKTSKEEIIKAMKGEDPKPIDTHFVIINNKRFSIKQVIEKALKIPLMGFTTMDAYRILENLKFEIHQK